MSIAGQIESVELQEDLDRLKFVNNLPLEKFYFVAFYVTTDFRPSLYFSPALGEYFTPGKKYVVERCRDKMYIIEAMRGNTFRRKKGKFFSTAGFISTAKIFKIGLEPKKHYPAYYNYALEAWVVVLD